MIKIENKIMIEFTNNGFKIHENISLFIKCFLVNFFVTHKHTMLKELTTHNIVTSITLTYHGCIKF